MHLTLNQRRCGRASLCWLEMLGSQHSGRTNVEVWIKSGWKIAEADKNLEATQEDNMSNVATIPPRVNGMLETSLYVESPARSAEFYRRVFGFEPLEPGEPLNDDTRRCLVRAGDRSVLLLFKKGATVDTDASASIHIAFGIARCDLPAWERWLKEQGISIELRKTWEYGGEALYFRDPDGHLLEVVTPGVWNIY